MQDMLIVPNGENDDEVNICEMNTLNNVTLKNALRNTGVHVRLVAGAIKWGLFRSFT